LDFWEAYLRFWINQSSNFASNTCINVLSCEEKWRCIGSLVFTVRQDMGTLISVVFSRAASCLGQMIQRSRYDDNISYHSSLSGQNDQDLSLKKGSSGYVSLASRILFTLTSDGMSPKSQRQHKRTSSLFLVADNVNTQEAMDDSTRPLTQPTQEGRYAVPCITDRKATDVSHLAYCSAYHPQSRLKLPQPHNHSNKQFQRKAMPILLYTECKAN
jgi:hypothetical protein